MGFLESMPPYVPKYLAEFLGTYILVLTIGCNALGLTEVWAVTSIAAAYMVGVYSLGPVSGAHFNPAVSLSILLCNKLPGGISEAIIYMLIQISGALCAAFTYILLYGGESFEMEPGTGHNWLQAAIAEMVYTCMLCLLVLNVACSSASKDNQYYGLAIGSVLIAGGYAAGSISGAALNPAVAIALDVSSYHRGLGMCVTYTAFQLLGAAGAASLFRLIRAEDYGGAKNALSSRLLSEFIGTFFLMITVGFNIQKASSATPWSVGACVMVLVYALGNCSGGHFNPAITLSVYLSGRGKIEGSDVCRYVVIQLAAGLMAGLTYMALLDLTFPANVGMTWGKTAVVEIVFSMLLCFTFLSVATVQKPSKDMFGFAIGSVVTAAWFAIPSNGACTVIMNPALALGIDFSNFVKGGYFGNSFWFSLMDCAGAFLAVQVFQVIRPHEYMAPKMDV